jgi:hypothetical protein
MFFSASSTDSSKERQEVRAPHFDHLWYIASNVRMTGEYWTGNDLEGNSRELTWSIIQAFSGGDWRKLWKVTKYPVFRPRLEPDTSQIQSRRATHSIGTLGIWGDVPWHIHTEYSTANSGWVKPNKSGREVVIQGEPIRIPMKIDIQKFY